MLKCQENSHLKEFETRIIECFEDDFTISLGRGKKTVRSFGIVFENTILFPEGGGQPSDQGILIIKATTPPLTDFELRVNYVLTLPNGKVVHLVEETWDFPMEKLPKGTNVIQKLNWTRRKFNMIHHSGQHLITALAFNLFGWKTLSWHLGEDCTYVELGTKAISVIELKKLEDEVNENISNSVPVTVHVYEEGDPELDKAKSRGLPENHGKLLRVVQMGNLDFNMCCGTHVTNLVQLEVIKFLKTKANNNKKEKMQSTLLYFIAGKEMLFKRFDNLLEQESLISSKLEKVPSEILSTIDGLKESMSLALKKIKTLEEENVLYEVKAFQQLNPMPQIFEMHRPSGGMDLLNFTSRNFIPKPENLILFLTCGETEEGSMLLVGDKTTVAEVGPQMCAIMMGKGFFNENKFQGKVFKLSARKDALEVLNKHLARFAAL